MKLNPEDVPNDYLYCFATDGQCPQCKECLHAQVAKFPLKLRKGARPITYTVDSRYIASLQAKGGCSLFRSATPRLFARGMSRLYDEAPGKLTNELRRRVQNCFSCRSFYFSSRKGDRLISPDEQQKIAAVFQQLCPNIRPVYDSFEEAFEWW